jgi:hypothetical protein
MIRSFLVYAVSASAVLVGTAGRLQAQDRPFVYSITTEPEPAAPQLRMDFDVSAGDSLFHSNQASGPEQRVSLQATGGRFTFIGRFGIAAEADPSTAHQSWQEAIALYSFTAPKAPIAIGAGGGIEREVDGTTVLLAHLVASHDSDLTRMTGNLQLEHAFAPGRDLVDVIVSAGWARKMGASATLGVEALGEDLEGFWDPTEAEGGSRLIVGPSIHVAPAGHKWQVSTVGGPLFHPDPTTRTSGALRDLPPTMARVGYAVELSFAYSVF